MVYYFYTKVEKQTASFTIETVCNWYLVLSFINEHCGMKVIVFCH